MDSFEFNKIAGAVLAALLLAFGAGTLSEIFKGAGHGDGHGDGHGSSGKPGYVLPVTAAVQDGKTGGAAAAAFSFATIAGSLKTASAENGAGVFKRCTACHTGDKDGKAGTGPNLWGILGRDIASSPTFPRYSAALKGAGGTWTWEKLTTYIHDPRATIPGNQMAFAGVKNNDELADLMIYLRSLNDKPLALPN